MTLMMQTSLGFPQFRQIEYRLRTLAFDDFVTNAPSAMVLQAIGDLVVRAVTNLVRMPLRIESGDQGQISASGSVSLKMTDFGIEPPPAGVAPGLKTGNEVKISFLCKLKRQQLLASGG